MSAQNVLCCWIAGGLLCLSSSVFGSDQTGTEYPRMGSGMQPGMMGPGYGQGWAGSRYPERHGFRPYGHWEPGMTGSGNIGPGMMGYGYMGGPGMMGHGHMGPGMMGYGPMGGSGMMGYGHMGPGMMGYGYMGPGMHGSAVPAMYVFWVILRLELSDGQAQSVRELQRQLRRDRWSRLGELMEHQDRLTELYEAEIPDAKVIGETHGIIYGIQRQIIEKSLKLQNDARALLTEPQRQILQKELKSSRDFGRGSGR